MRVVPIAQKLQFSLRGVLGVSVGGEAAGDHREEAGARRRYRRPGQAGAAEEDADWLQACGYIWGDAVRLHRFEISPSEYDLTVTLFYEYMPRTLREYLMESSLRGEELT